MIFYQGIIRVGQMGIYLKRFFCETLTIVIDWLIRFRPFLLGTGYLALTVPRGAGLDINLGIDPVLTPTNGL